MPAPDWLESAALVGDTLGGVATAVALFVALREVRSWREQKRAEARSGPAAAALVEVRDTCAFIHNWCTFMQIAEVGESPPGEVSGGARDGIPWGRSGLGPHVAGLQKVEVQAFVHLDEPERQVIWDAKGLLDQLDLEVRHLDGAIQRIPRERVLAVFGGLVRAAEELRVRADQVLRPIARFDSPPKRPWWRFLGKG